MEARVEDGIDAAWLEQLREADPVRHAWAVWDRLTFPDKVEFRTLYEDRAPTAYLIIWHGSPKATVVHWIGTAKDPSLLLNALPRRPLVATVPVDLALEVERRRGPAKRTATPTRSGRCSSARSTGAASGRWPGRR
ncbi:MAG: hypothetical protein L3J91_05655 [Thermoplasmata archaeon]|nr:hypothetical protein [Thermoplasmata archaeon]